eukprot:Hpha_TRINITY_DN15295_c2_g3::TRINITY_DN15295_c2_g3_i1::g.68417::m.68417
MNMRQRSRSLQEDAPELSSLWREGLLQHGETKCPEQMKPTMLYDQSRAGEEAFGLAVSPCGGVACVGYGSSPPPAGQHHNVQVPAGAIRMVDLGAEGLTSPGSPLLGQRRGSRRPSNFGLSTRPEVRFDYPARAVAWGGASPVLVM